MTGIEIPGKATPAKISVFFHQEGEKGSQGSQLSLFFQNSTLFRFTFYRLGFVTCPQGKKNHNALKNSSVIPFTN